MRLVAFAGPGTTLGLRDAFRRRWDQALGGYVLANLWSYEVFAPGLEEALRKFAPDRAGPPAS